MDHFEVFGLERRLALDPAALQRRFYELSRRWHPDFHQGAAPETQARVLEASARLNAAYRALRDPIARIEYVVRLEAGGTTMEGTGVKPAAPPALLAEMFETQEALEEARAGALDAAARTALRARHEELVGRRRALESRLTGPLSRAWDAAAPADRPAALAALAATLAERAYLRTVIDDLAAVLSEPEPEEGHVAHRRH